MKLIAQVLTSNSWILEDSVGTKIGVISYVQSKEKYLLITSDMDVELDSFSELESTLGSIKIRERKTSTEAFKDVGGYSICHSSATEIKEIPKEIADALITEKSEKLFQYIPEGKSKKPFYAGYWCTLQPEGHWKSRISLSVEIHSELNEQNAVKGPFKDRMQCNFAIKKLNS